MSLVWNIVIRTSTLLLLTTLAASLLRRASAATRYSIWAIGLLAALALPFAARILPDLNLPLLTYVKSSVAAAQIPNADKPIIKPMPTSLAGQIVEAPAGSLALSENPVPKIPWFAIIWAAGGLIVAIRSLFGLLDVRRLRHGSQPVTDIQSLQLLSEVKEKMSISATVALRIGGSGIPPMTWGLLHHTILLPSAAADWRADRLRLVIMHELAHVRRKDGLMQLVTQAACGIYWFQPLAWYAAYRMRTERERACDDKVLNLGTEAEDYADHLLQIARGVLAGPTFATISMAHPSQLESRIRSILNNKENRRTPSGFAKILLAISALLLMSLTAATHLSAVPTAPFLTNTSTIPEPIHSTPLAELPSQGAGTSTTATATVRFGASQSVPQFQHIAGAPFGTRGGIVVEFRFPEDGEYDFRSLIEGSADGQTYSSATDHQLSVSIDGERVALIDVPRTTEQASVGLNITTSRIFLKNGLHRVAAVFVPKTHNLVNNDGLQKWLDEDVAYIITDDEKSALKTAFPRLHFLEIRGPFKSVAAKKGGPAFQPVALTSSEEPTIVQQTTESQSRG